MSEFHDANQLPSGNQVTPTNYQTPGALTTVTSPQYIGKQGTAQISTQVNPFPGTLSSQSVVARQQVAVVGPVYVAPSGAGVYGLTTQGSNASQAAGVVATGGGP